MEFVFVFILCCCSVSEICKILEFVLLCIFLDTEIHRLAFVLLIFVVFFVVCIIIYYAFR
jgi:hypothetical protein